LDDKDETGIQGQRLGVPHNAHKYQRNAHKSTNALKNKFKGWLDDKDETGIQGQKLGVPHNAHKYQRNAHKSTNALKNKFKGWLDDKDGNRDTRTKVRGIG
jgi:hypothetical protein